MGPIDVFWHFLNFFAPAIGAGLLAASFAKLLWRRELQRTSWSRLGAWAVGSCALALMVGLVVFGQDGKMATYAGMIVACTLALWWAGFGPKRH